MNDYTKTMAQAFQDELEKIADHSQTAKLLLGGAIGGATAHHYGKKAVDDYNRGRQLRIQMAQQAASQGY